MFWARRLDGLKVTTKSDLSPVTEADRATEAAMRTAVRQARPFDGFLGEEGGGPVSADRVGRRWIVDPIDGMADYVAGGRSWVTNIALEVDGEIEVAIISSSARGVRWEAVRERGARRNDESIRVSEVGKITECRWTTYLGDDGLRDSAPVRALLEIAPRMQQPHSYPAVADGRVDITFDLSGGEWDFAAATLLVEEAGGQATDLEGRARIDTGTMLATNGRLYPSALAALHGS
jgi:histidinol-phosphatase